MLLLRRLLFLVIYPRHSMYAVYAYIDPSNHPNVGIYTIHGVSGYDICCSHVHPQLTHHI